METGDSLSSHSGEKVVSQSESMYMGTG